MGRKKIVEETSKELKPIRRAIDPEVRENQMIALAINEAERQLRSGTASSQVIVHYLKLGTQKEKLELEKIKNENLLLLKKVETLETLKDAKELSANAIAAMKKYTGNMED